MAAPGPRTGRALQPRLISLEPCLSHVEEIVDDCAALRNLRGSAPSLAEPFDVSALTL